MEANHTLRNAFSQELDFPKSIIFLLAPAMVEPCVAIEPWSFYSPEPLPFLPYPLENSEALQYSKYSQWLIRSSRRRCSIKSLFLKISQYSQEGTCIGVSFSHLCSSLFLIKLQIFRPATLLKWESNEGALQSILRSFWKCLFWKKFLNNLFWIMSSKIFHSFIWRLQNRSSYICSKTYMPGCPF